MVVSSRGRRPSEASAQLMALTPSTTLGPYDVTAQIGQGGMGEVYRARDTKLNRDVALKVLPDAFASDPDRLAPGGMGRDSGHLGLGLLRPGKVVERAAPAVDARCCGITSGRHSHGGGLPGVLD